MFFICSQQNNNLTGCYCIPYSNCTEKTLMPSYPGGTYVNSCDLFSVNYTTTGDEYGSTDGVSSSTTNTPSYSFTSTCENLSDMPVQSSLENTCPFTSLENVNGFLQSTETNTNCTSSGLNPPEPPCSEENDVTYNINMTPPQQLSSVVGGSTVNITNYNSIIISKRTMPPKKFTPPTGGLHPEITLPHEQSVELYHNSLSLCSGKVRVVLAEKNIPYKANHIHLIETGWYQNASPEFLKINPGATVPVLVHDGHPVYESHDQVEYAEILGNQINKNSPSLKPAPNSGFVDDCE